eukprot:TRINITY_DN11578_c0_g1_i4.p1 TRINITY_DN11578_c0_g1~~TRINITY_DN11578_c0_g1_i4.p1  ORF type:complete len:802 (+),score=186.44 TRINITY_DN11578_c0_g1_i4:100-2505(+)
MTARLSDIQEETELLRSLAEGFSDDGSDTSSSPGTGQPRAKRSRLQILEDIDDIVDQLQEDALSDAIDIPLSTHSFDEPQRAPKAWQASIQAALKTYELPDTATGRALALNRLYQDELQKQLAAVRLKQRANVAQRRVHEARRGFELNVGRPSLAQQEANKELPIASASAREAYQGIFAGQQYLQIASTTFKNYLHPIDGSEPPQLSLSSAYDELVAAQEPFHRDIEGWHKDLVKKLRNAVTAQLKVIAAQELVDQPKYADIRDKAHVDFTSQQHALRMQLVEEQEKLRAQPNSFFEDMSTEQVDWEKVAACVRNKAGSKTAEQCRLRWERDECSSAKRKWSKEEDKTLLALVRDNPDKDFAWYATQLARKLPQYGHRRRLDVIVRYQRHLNIKKKRVTWSKDDDARLLAVMKHVPDKDWMLASQQMKDRTAAQIMHRWSKSIDPSIRRCKWTREEDDLLIEGVRRYEKSWSKVQRLVPNRTDTQCRERFVNVLAKNPETAARARMYVDIPWRRGAWDKEEDEALLACVEELGRKWSKVASAMKSKGWRRDDAQCLRRWGALKPKECLHHLRAVKARKTHLASTRATSRRRRQERSNISLEDVGIKIQEYRLDARKEAQLKRLIELRAARRAPRRRRTGSGQEQGVRRRRSSSTHQDNDDDNSHQHGVNMPPPSPLLPDETSNANDAASTPSETANSHASAVDNQSSALELLQSLVSPIVTPVIGPSSTPATMASTSLGQLPITSMATLGAANIHVTAMPAMPGSQGTAALETTTSTTTSLNTTTFQEVDMRAVLGYHTRT